ncbi:hypothetical protein OM343_22965 [Escherichia albertii]|nr:hypothetical protein [Escherichia albertii]
MANKDIYEVLNQKLQMTENKDKQPHYYSDNIDKKESEKQRRTTISLNENLLIAVEDLALKNKRNGKDPKNVSAIVRKALEQYLNSHNV